MQAHARGSGSRANDVASRTVPVPRVGVALARNASEVEEAQRLRYAVFAEELGARLPETQLSAARRIDRDAFDPYCEHLIARDLGSGEVVGTYRILTPDAARAAGSYYSEQEFDLARLAHLRAQMVEVGRSCVHPDYRSGAVINLLWAELTRYMLQQGHEYLVGCASIPLQPLQSGPERSAESTVAAIYQQLSERYLAPAEYRGFARKPMALPRLVTGAAGAEALPARPSLPPLIKGYLRLGAWVCSDPALDGEFNSVDVLILLPVSRMSARYARHYAAV